MEPDTYGGLLNSAPSISSSNTNNYENRSSFRPHSHKKRHDNLPSIDNQDERIEVKILPQDDNWGETTTMTCNTGNDDTLTTNNETNIQINNPIENFSNKIHSRTRWILIYHFVIYFLCLIAFVSPILFLTLPYTLNRSNLILINDYTLLLTIIFKLLLLFLGTLLLLHRRRNTIYLPRIHLHKIFFLFVLISILLTYWFYYIFKLLPSMNTQYEQIFSMTSTYEDLLLFLLIIIAIRLEIKWFYPKWIVKVVRSPDGQTKQYTIGK
jgi:vang-like